MIRVRADLAIVNTVDYFPPLVDDAYSYGQIAASNALSDVYAMGGRPLSALNILCADPKKIPAEILGQVLAGGAERVAAAGAELAGGHSVVDDQLKYGLAVTGTVHPDRFVRNGGARAGDVLVLTKSLGTGILATAMKAGATTQAEDDFAIASMVALNDVAGSFLARYGARACTDVTGFGLAGHAAEMARASTKVRLEIEAEALPLLPGTARLADAGYVTGGAGRNREWLGRSLQIAKGVAPAVAQAVMDPQSSGGLLVSIPQSKAQGYIEALHRKGTRSFVVGKVVRRSAGSPILVRVA